MVAVKGISACNANHMLRQVSFSSFEGKYHLVIMWLREGRRRAMRLCPAGASRQEQDLVGLGNTPPFTIGQRIHERSVWHEGVSHRTLSGYCELVRVQRTDSTLLSAMMSKVDKRA